MNPQELQNEMNRLKQEIDSLKSEVYLNNFSARQDFNKYSDFRFRLKVPSYTSNPSTCQVGEIIENSGVLYICSATNTWTKVGTQT